MNTAVALIKYGQPSQKNEPKYMEVWSVPQDIRDALAHVYFSATGKVGFPKTIYCNKDFAKPLEQGLRNMINRGFAHEMKTWDGCYMLRLIRGSLINMSQHSWGNAFDTNQEENQLGQKPKLSDGFVKCFTDAGLIWGGNFTRRDGMHFELANPS